MNNSISTSLNMRSLKEAMADQESYEEMSNPIEEESTDIVESSFDHTEIQSSPMDKANSDMSELDQEVYNHTQTANDVLQTAKDTFDTITTLAQSVPPEKSARLFEVAAQYLEIMNKSSDSKVTAKFDRAKLSVSLIKAQLQAGVIENAVNQGIKAHRNDILKAIMEDDVQEADFTKKSNTEEDK